MTVLEAKLGKFFIGLVLSALLVVSYCSNFNINSAFATTSNATLTGKMSVQLDTYVEPDPSPDPGNPDPPNPDPDNLYKRQDCHDLS